ncbi:DnaB-like helicase C-terminal domain-containing protein [Deinococcus sp. SL84]|uniref:DnaB-like helicase C-terminal domain-containing protein n=1 Tax=Deinococcus sp. SL84 TaxID=2994663 RepID=UPI0022752521|nr:DnaB-like helicase C-terminal domain-containing protein [Deinococcus sp. SL84]MCY1703888.1 hypothetical protein [Deinococcus sp. SL84]
MNPSPGDLIHFTPGLHLLAGPPGIGTSSLAHQLALEAAQAGLETLYLAPEHAAAQTRLMHLAQLSGIPLNQLHRMTPATPLDPDVRRRLSAAAEQLYNSGLPLRRLDGRQAKETLQDLLGGRLRLPELLLLDRLEDTPVSSNHTFQPSSITEYQERERQRWITLTARLQTLALQWAIPVIATTRCQMQDAATPQLADLSALRIGQQAAAEATSVTFLHRERYYQNTDRDLAELICLKGTGLLWNYAEFNPECATFHPQPQAARLPHGHAPSSGKMKQ